METENLLVNALYYLTAAVIAVPLFKKLGLGSILGYLCAGMVLGPDLLGLIHDPEEVLRFAEYGVILLLFIIGLELAPDKLWDGLPVRERDSLMFGPSAPAWSCCNH